MHILHSSPLLYQSPILLSFGAHIQAPCYNSLHPPFRPTWGLIIFHALLKFPHETSQESPIHFFTSSKLLQFFESKEHDLALNCLLPSIFFLHELRHLPRQKTRFSISKNYIIPLCIISIRIIIDSIY